MLSPVMSLHLMYSSYHWIITHRRNVLVGVITNLDRVNVVEMEHLHFLCSWRQHISLVRFSGVEALSVRRDVGRERLQHTWV